MLLDFYRPRWQSFINVLRISLATGREPLDFGRYDPEYQFTTLPGHYATEPAGDLRQALQAVIAEVI